MSIDVKHEAESGGCDAVRTPEPAPAAGSYDPTAQVRGDGSATTSEAASEAASVVDVLDVDGVTRLLRIGRNTVYELVGRNEIPHRRLGKQIRFSRAAIMRWLDPWSLQGAKERQ